MARQGSSVDEDHESRIPSPRSTYEQRRDRLRRDLAVNLAKTVAGVLTVGGLFTLVALGGDGNPSPDQSKVLPHTHAAFSVATFAAFLGVLVALLILVIYVVRVSLLAHEVRNAVRR